LYVLPEHRPNFLVFTIKLSRKTAKILGLFSVYFYRNNTCAKTESQGYHVGCSRDLKFSRFDTTPVYEKCTHRHNGSIYCASIALCSKNQKMCSKMEHLFQMQPHLVNMIWY